MIQHDTKKYKINQIFVMKLYIFLIIIPCTTFLNTCNVMCTYKDNIVVY